MTGRMPAIAAIGVIGRHNNPLHISLFPPGQRPALEFQFLLSTSLDIFEMRLPHKTADQDFGLLQCIDERLAMYGWLTNTGVRFVIIVDMEGRPVGQDVKYSAVLGLSAAEVKPVRSPAMIGVDGAMELMFVVKAFRALQTAYVGLLRNPFYDPDEHNPLNANARNRIGSTQITDRRFINEVARIAEIWAPGVTNI